MTELRADLVDVYLFRRSPAVELLQLRRTEGTLAGTWQPIMGHIEPGETAAACAVRELSEEVGLRAGDPALLGLWALQGVHPYYLPARDAIMLSPRFAAEVRPDWSPTLNDEHDAFRWIGAGAVRERFVWPGQWAAIDELLEWLLRPGSGGAPLVRLPGR